MYSISSILSELFASISTTDLINGMIYYKEKTHIKEINCNINLAIDYLFANM